MASTQNTQIGLAEAIQQLREDLTKAQERAQNEDLQFKVGQIELELELVIEQEAGIDGGIKFLIASLGANERIQTAQTHRVKILLDPTGPNGESLNVSGTGTRETR